MTVQSAGPARAHDLLGPPQPIALRSEKPTGVEGSLQKASWKVNYCNYIAISLSDFQRSNTNRGDCTKRTPNTDGTAGPLPRKHRRSTIPLKKAGLVYDLTETGKNLPVEGRSHAMFGWRNKKTKLGFTNHRPGHQNTRVQKIQLIPPKKPRRGPYWGAKTPIPVPFRSW